MLNSLLRCEYLNHENVVAKLCDQHFNEQMTRYDENAKGWIHTRCFLIGRCLRFESASNLCSFALHTALILEWNK